MQGSGSNHGALSLVISNYQGNFSYQVSYQVWPHLFQRILRNMWGHRARRTKSVHKEAHRISSHSIETILERVDASRVNHMLW